jgi:hypothetical protein
LECGLKPQRSESGRWNLIRYCVRVGRGPWPLAPCSFCAASALFYKILLCCKWCEPDSRWRHLKWPTSLPVPKAITGAHLILRADDVALAVAACANRYKSPPRDPRDPPSPSCRGVAQPNHTRCAESRNGCIQRISGPPSDP